MSSACGHESVCGRSRDTIAGCSIAGKHWVHGDKNPTSPYLHGTADNQNRRTPHSVGPSCYDGNVCNGEEACDGSGNCIPGKPLTCVTENPCLEATCDPLTGCTASPKPIGTSCSDGNPCNGEETCDGSGACAPGSPPIVDDGNPCTVDTCDPVLGVLHEPLSGGASCSDGDACNGEEFCDGYGTCLQGEPPPIDDGDPCTIDLCDPITGVSHTRLNTPGCVPVLVAPELDLTVPRRMFTSTAFLYSEASPVQYGVEPGTIEEHRVSIIRGRVLGADGVTPESGVTITINGHPEFGHTLTRDDGQYDMAVNGGTTYIVHMESSEHLPVQRPAPVGWHDWTVVEDVVLTQPYTSPDVFTVGSSVPQLVRGEYTPDGEDEDDGRQVVLYFPENTRITNLSIPDGTPLEVQLTEFTRGPYGYQRMPGILPPTSGYTYAFEATFPATTGMGVEDVLFDRDVIVYVDNFTHYPVGEPVPMGYYDRKKGAWLASESGHIIRILSVSDGIAVIDVSGDGVADGPEHLDNLGITDRELETLASEYPAGTELWRVPIRHFSTWDCNWGFGAPLGSGPPPNPSISPEDIDDPCTRDGSIIGCETRTLGESLPIVGTPYRLHYQNDRTPGFKQLISFPVAGDKLPSTPPSRIIVQVELAGRVFWDFPPVVPNTRGAWIWDGLDAYGREVVGDITGILRVGYQYSGTSTYATPVFGGSGSRGGGGSGGGGSFISGDRDTRIVTYWKTTVFTMRGHGAKSLGLGGWTLDAHHAFGTDSWSLFRGDGRQQTNVRFLSQLVETFAGGGTTSTDQDDGPATKAYLGDVSDIAEAADGSIYIAVDGNSSYPTGRIRRVSPDGIISTIAGLPPTVPKVDGQPALNAELAPAGIAVGPDGTLYFTDRPSRQVWAIVPGSPPTLRHIAGNGKPFPNSATCIPPAQPTCGDDGDARHADLRQPVAIAVGSDGTVFLHDQATTRGVRRVGPEGTITTYLSTTPSTMVNSIALRGDDVMFAWLQGGAVTRIEPNGDVQPDKVV
ncbi:MAG: hypothetical protein FWD57_13710, partial [Polyangiaceae bacterium]|nr:hypothetical protein [Polyangiaceae bacterium]